MEDKAELLLHAGRPGRRATVALIEGALAERSSAACLPLMANCCNSQTECHADKLPRRGLVMAMR